jgi:hypothetical protein
VLEGFAAVNWKNERKMEMETDELLTIKVTTIVQAPPEVLRERLAEKRAECDRRAAKYKGWAGTVSGKWLLDDIAKLEAALSLPSNVGGSGRCGAFYGAGSSDRRERP